MKVKHYSIPFKGFNGKDYEVEIHTEDYDGDVVVLTGAPNTFVLEEDEDYDPFLPVRVTSGYINFIDENEEGRNIIANSPFDLLVRLKENGSTVWTGYVQPQQFTAAWEAPPRTIELPVIDRLGILKSAPYVPDMGTITIKEAIEKCLAGAQVTTRAVLFADIKSSQTRYVREQTMTFSDLLFYKKEKEEKLFDGINPDLQPNENNGYSCFEVLEEICKMMGWSARTTLKGVYFTSTIKDYHNSNMTFFPDKQEDLPDTVRADNTEELLPGRSQVRLKVDTNKMDKDIISLEVNPRNFIRRQEVEHQTSVTLYVADLYNNDENTWCSLPAGTIGNDVGKNKTAGASIVCDFWTSLQKPYGYKKETALTMTHDSTLTYPIFARLRSKHPVSLTEEGKYIDLTFNAASSHRETTSLPILTDRYFDKCPGSTTMWKLSFGVGDNLQWYNGTAWTNTEAGFTVSCGANGDGANSTAPGAAIPTMPTVGMGRVIPAPIGTGYFTLHIAPFVNRDIIREGFQFIYTRITNLKLTLCAEREREDVAEILSDDEIRFNKQLSSSFSEMYEREQMMSEYGGDWALCKVSGDEGIANAILNRIGDWYNRTIQVIKVTVPYKAYTPDTIINYGGNKYIMTSISYNFYDSTTRLILQKL